MLKLLLLALAPLLALGLGEPLAETQAPPAPPAPLLAPKDCPESRMVEADRAPRTLAPQKLGDLPPAAHERAVLYREDGCLVPVIVSENVEATRR